MSFELSLNRPAATVTVILLALIAAALGIFLVVSGFITGTLTDERFKPDQGMLQFAASQFSGSSRLHARIAAAEMVKSERDMQLVKFHAQQAADLSPYDYRNRMLLASVKEAEGDRAAAEQALKEAVRLAPNYPDPRWRLANLLLRQGKLGRALEEFRTAAALKPSLLPATLDLVWGAAGGNLLALEAVISTPEGLVELARFLLKRSRAADAVAVFNRMERDDMLASADTPAFLNGLIGGGHYGPARRLWLEMVGGDPQAAGVWNGGFEFPILKNFGQFDWAIARSDYARIGLTSAAARGGSRSLKIEFAGRDTTRLGGEVKQLVVVRPGVRHRLECYVRTEGLEAPEGPRLAVLDGASAEIAASDPIAPGTNDWRLLEVDFTAPASKTSEVSVVYITIQRKPKFSYDEPTKGSVWFDDFRISEQ